MQSSDRISFHGCVQCRIAQHHPPAPLSSPGPATAQQRKLNSRMKRSPFTRGRLSAIHHPAFCLRFHVIHARHFADRLRFGGKTSADGSHGVHAQRSYNPALANLAFLQICLKIVQSVHKGIALHIQAPQSWTCAKNTEGFSLPWGGMSIACTRASPSSRWKPDGI